MSKSNDATNSGHGSEPWGGARSIATPAPFEFLGEFVERPEDHSSKQTRPCGTSQSTLALPEGEDSHPEEDEDKRKNGAE